MDNSGYLDSKEFVACIQSLDLGLTISTLMPPLVVAANGEGVCFRHLTRASLARAGEIEALMAAADANGDERVDYQEFIKFAYDSLLSLGREKYLRALQKAAENRKVSTILRVAASGIGGPA